MAEDTKSVQDIYKAVQKLSKQYKSIGKPEFTKSGSIVLDAILGGGIPKGVFILWSAENGCGKSTGALHISRTYCVQGKRVLYLDYEHGVNDSQIKGMGLSEYLYDEDSNPNGSFILFQVHTYKDGETILDSLMESVDLVIIDSVTSILAEKMKEGSAEDVTIGVDARIQSQFLKKYKAEASRSGTSWILINQMRTKIATGWGQVTHDEEAGGNALKFYSDIRLSMKKAYKGTLEREEETASGKQKVPFGAICTITALKNRYERPMIPLNIALIFGKGIDNNFGYEDFLEYKGAIVKNGAWYTIKFGDIETKVSGLNRVIEWIDANKDKVKEYIKSEGGYKLLLNNKNETVDINDESVYTTEEISNSDFEMKSEED